MTDMPTLPEFEAKVSKDFPEFLIVFCPRDDCPGTKHERPFLVHMRTWLRPDKVEIKTGRRAGTFATIVGRSCPYCFRAARLPRRGAIRR